MKDLDPSQSKRTSFDMADNIMFEVDCEVGKVTLFKESINIWGLKEMPNPSNMTLIFFLPFVI